MKIRSTVHWPEREIECNQVVDLPDDEARARIAQGFAVEAPEEPAAEEQPARSAEE